MFVWKTYTFTWRDFSKWTSFLKLVNWLIKLFKFIYFVTERKANDWHYLQQLKYNCNQIVSLFYPTDLNTSFQNSNENCYCQTYEYVHTILKNIVLINILFTNSSKTLLWYFKLVQSNRIHLYSIFMNNIHPDYKVLFFLVKLPTAVILNVCKTAYQFWVN